MLTLEQDLLAILRLLSDATRLRILALLERQELSVGELARCLGLAQSRVSNHLRLLREVGYLVERHSGSSTYLRLVLAPEGVAGRLWGTVREGLEGLPEHGLDRSRLAQVLSERDSGADFFERLAGDYDKIAGGFETGQARQRAAAQLLPRGLTVADIGCGTGYMARALENIAARLILVDKSERMLKAARERMSNSTAVLDFRLGQFEELPLADAEVDALMAGMVLHHLPRLDQPLLEMRRVLRPGGTAVVLELYPHNENWMKRALGDQHLGLAPTDVVAAFKRAGFEHILLDAVEDRYRPRRDEVSDPDPDSGSSAPNSSTQAEIALPLFLVRASKPLGQH